MKKILILMLVLALATPFMFSWHDLTNTAGMGNYSIDMKLHNVAQAAYQNLEMEVGLPIHDKFKMYFWIKDMTFEATFNQSTEYTAGTALSDQTWTAIRGVLRMYLGFNISDTFQMNILVGGGSDNIGMNPFWGGGTAGKYQLITYNDGTVETKSGCGLIQFGVGLVLKSAMFGSKIDNLTIINILEMRMGYGTAYMGSIPLLTPYASQVTSTRPGSGTTTNTKSETFGIGYDLEVGTGIPLEIGLPKFNVGLSWQMKIQYYTMTKLERPGTVVDFAVNPAKFNFYTNFKVNFAINPTDNISTNTWLRPAVEFTNYTWTPTGRAAQSVLTPAFELRFGQNINITFAKICYVKFENEWKYVGQMNSFYADPVTGELQSTSGNMTDHTRTPAGQWTNSVLDNPDMEIGFRFSGWTLGASWRPRITVYDASGGNATNVGQGGADQAFNTSSGADTNILNLSNWEIMMSLSFPPPKK